MEHLKVVSETEDELVLEGPIVLFGGSDLSGEHFDAGTDFESSYTRSGRLYVDWEHGQEPDRDKSGKPIAQPGEDDVLGYVDWPTVRKDDIGLLARHVLNRRERYVREFVEPLVRAGLVGSSSEATRQGIVRSADGKISRWPLKRQSLTVTPMEPRLLTEHQLSVVKNLAESFPELKALLLEGAGESAVEAGEGMEDGEAKSNHGDEAMPEDVNVITRDEFTRAVDEIKAQLGAVTTLDASVKTILETLERMPAAKKAGLIAPDSEEDHEEVKSFADFLLAVRYGNQKRLQEVYKSTPVRTNKSGWRKDLSGETGTAGGFLVPVAYEQTLLQLGYSQSAIMQRVTRMPVGSDAGKIPALDQYVTPTAGSGEVAAAAGVEATQRAPGASLTETEPGFEQVQFNISNAGGYTEVENELIADSPLAIGALLERLFGIAVAAKNTRNILRGSGAGEPLGILNAGAAIGIAPDTNNLFAYADALEMKSRFKSTGGQPMWVWHPGIWPDVGVFEVGTGGAVFMANLSTGPAGRLLGYEYEDNEHLPQDDNSGCVLLADFSAYLFFERQGLVVAFSEHAAFTTNKGTWRFTVRNDGQPWVRSAITLADPQGSYTVSPFVYLND